MEKKIILEMDKNNVLNLIESLNYYKDVIKPQYKSIIDNQINDIVKQLLLQDIKILKFDHESQFKLGEMVKYDGLQGIVIGESNKECFVKLALAPNMKIEEVPQVLIEKNV